MAQQKREVAQSDQPPQRHEQPQPTLTQQAEFGLPSGLEPQADPARPAELPAQPALLRLQQQAGNRAVQRLIQRAQQQAGPAQVTPAVVQGITRARGGGQPLDAAVRAQFEPAFGVDFAAVRVHTDSSADQLSRAVEARAFATGSDLFFRQGAYQPGSSDGRALLAHELTHVVQQQGASAASELTVSQPGDRAEVEAEQVSQAVMQQTAVARPSASPAQVQRQPVESPDQTAQLEQQARGDAAQIRAILQSNTWLGPYNQRDIMAIIEKWASQSTTDPGQTPFDRLIAALRQSTFQVGMLASQLTSTFDQLFARLSSENVARLQQLIQTRAHTFRGERALELARFEVSKDDVLDAAQLSAEVAAAFATGGGSVLAQIVIWLGTTLPGLYRKAEAVINFVETIRSLKLDDVQQLFSAPGLGDLLVRALFGELPPLATIEREPDAPAEQSGGREERGLVAVFHGMIRAFAALRRVYGSVVEVINKNLARITITGAPWFERFSMVYAGIVRAVDTVTDPAAVLREAVGGLREMIGSFFSSIKGRIGDVAAMLKAQLQQLSNPAQLMQRLADKAVEMVLNFIVTHPPSALVKVAFRAIEVGSKSSIVELVRQHIPFADTLIQSIAQSNAVQTLLRPLQGPATAISGATERVAGAAGGLVGEVEGRVGGLVGDGARMVQQLSGIDIEQGRRDSDPVAPQRPAASGAAGGDGLLSVIARGLHTRLLAHGTRNLRERGQALGRAGLERGLEAGRALAGKIKGLLIGEIVDFEAGGEQHQLWVEDRNGTIVPMMASVPISLWEKLEAYRTAIHDLRDPTQRQRATALVTQLDTTIQRMTQKANRAAARMNPLKQQARQTITELERLTPLAVRFARRPTHLRLREDVQVDPATGRVQITSQIGFGPGRQHFEERLPAPTDVGLPGWDRAHLAGQGTGREFTAGLMYAPADFNQKYHYEVEALMSELHLHAEAARRATPPRQIQIWQRATAIPFDRTTRRLRQGIYEIFKVEGSEVVNVAIFQIRVEPPTPSKPLPDVEITELTPRR